MVVALIVWSLAADVFPTANPGLSPVAYLAMALSVTDAARVIEALRAAGEPHAFTVRAVSTGLSAFDAVVGAGRPSLFSSQQRTRSIPRGD